MRPDFDERDAAIVAECVAALEEREGYRVGDFVVFSTVTRRISYIWEGCGVDGDDLVQTSDGGSYHLGRHGVSMSGSLHTPVPGSSLMPTEETRDGNVWIFHHELAGGDRGVHTNVAFRVFRCDLPAPGDTSPATSRPPAVANLDITDSPWGGGCATTGLTMDDFAAMLDGVEAPAWVKRAAVSISRSYATVIGVHINNNVQRTRPTAELVAIIEGHRLGRRETWGPTMTRYAEAEKLDSPPQYAGEEPWVRQAAVAICERWQIEGLCDPLYIANTIRGEEIDADHPGDRYRRHS